MSVGAVNKQTGDRIPTAGIPVVDSVLSGTSTNPVQNRVVKEAFDGKQDTLTFDDVPTDGSNNPVKSNGIYDSEKDIYAAMGEMGAKNLIQYPYYETTKTKNGVTFTDNGDGTISVTGRAEGGDATFILHTRNQGEINDFTIPNGDYILSGCPSGGTSSSFYLNIGCTKNDAWYTLGEDFGNGKKITCNGDDHSQTSVNPAINIIIKSGYSITGTLTFKPMLRLASDTDGTYQPYAKTNKQLTDDVSLLGSEKADTNIVAADFNAGTSYTAGNYCIYEGKFYKFKNSHSGAWSAADVDEIKIAGELSSLKSGLTSLNSIIKTVNMQPDTATDDNIKRDILSIMSDAHAPYCVNVRYSGEDAMLLGARMGNNYVSAIVIGISTISYYKYFGGAWTVTPIA